MTAAGSSRRSPWRHAPLAILLGALMIGARSTPPRSLAVPPPAVLPPAAAPRAPHVCVMAPRVEAGPGGEARAEVPLPRPTLFAVGSFEVIRIERDGQPPWTLTSDDEGPIHGPVGWPLAPIRPGERLRLRLRPVGAPAEDFATIRLVGAPAARMARSEALLRQLGDDPARWLSAVESELANGDMPLVMALLFAVEGPSAPELDALRMEVFRRGCGTGGPFP